jgi:N-acetylornithine carbamoyltransferase
MSKRDFLDLEDWSPEDIEGLLNLAAQVKRGEVQGGLEKKVLAMVLLDPSLRTRTSFETAMFLHGGHAVVLEPGKGSWPLETEPGAVMDGSSVEHLVEAARVLGRYADAVGVRAFPRGRDWATARQDAIVKGFARYCEKPVINLESARRHPCQALADALTLREKLGRVEGKRFVLAWAWHPKALPTSVPVSAALAAARLGMEIVIARPEGYELDPEDTALIRRTAQAAGGEFVHIIDDPDDALVGADAVYVKSWGSVKLYGNPEQEAEARAGLRDWRLTASRLRSTRGGKGIVMHCLPVRRNVEIDDKVLDGPNSVVVDQAENRLHAQRALLLELIGESRDRQGDGVRSWGGRERGH